MLFVKLFQNSQNKLVLSYISEYNQVQLYLAWFLSTYHFRNEFNADSLFVHYTAITRVTPLVHAHIGEESSDQGFHLPGYGHNNVNHQAPEFHAITHARAEEYSIISVGAGIKHKKTFSDYNTPQYCLPTEHFSLTRSTIVPPFLKSVPSITTFKQNIQCSFYFSNGYR